jgi:hypothetical protein
MRRRRWLVPLLLIPALGWGGGAVWASTASGPMTEARAVLQSNAEVQVTTEPCLVFRPMVDHPTAGLALYPGGRVDPRSYAYSWDSLRIMPIESTARTQAGSLMLALAIG